MQEFGDGGFRGQGLGFREICGGDIPIWRFKVTVSQIHRIIWVINFNKG